MEDAVLDFENHIKLQAGMELAWQVEALREAQDEGKWSFLAGHIRHGGRITPQMRQFLADVLDGKRKRPRKKISRDKARTDFRNVLLLSYISWARQHGEKDVLAKAAEKFGLHPRNVQKILAMEREGSNEKLAKKLVQSEKLEELIYSFLGKDPKDAPFAMLRRGANYRRATNLPSVYESAVARVRQGGVPKYTLSAMALAPYVGFPTRETVKWDDLPKDQAEDQPSHPL